MSDLNLFGRSLLGCTLAASMAACSASDGGGGGPITTGGMDPIQGVDGDVNGGGDTPPAPVGPPPIADGDIPECAQTGNLDLTAAKTNVMLLVDGSSSMEPHWSTVRDAMRQMILANPDADFGVHMFFAAGDLGGFFDDGNLCGETEHPRLEVGPNQEVPVLNAMGAAPPGTGAFIPTSPVVSGLNWYLENQSPLTDSSTTNYIVVISDFADDCFGTVFATSDAISDEAGQENIYAYEKIAVELRKRNIRIIPIGFDRDADPMNPSTTDTNMEALEALTRLGGTGITEPILADTGNSLSQALETVSRAVRPCRFQIPATVENSFLLSFYVDGDEVPRDRTRADGWDFVTGGITEVEFHGSYCDALQGEATLGAVLGCSAGDVCGTAATEVTFKDRAMHILLDASASMASEAGGIIIDSIFGNTTELTSWGYATAALSNMVTSPINDDMEFGFQLFPTRENSFAGCEVGAPEVAVGEGTEISIVDEMVSKIPNGGTPLLAALESVRDNPGRLAEDGVVGSLLVVGDGADGCSGGTDVVPALAQASRDLANMGVDVYPVQFASEPSQEQIAQMQAIAFNGRSDGSQGEVLNAPDGEALTMVLQDISRGLASCNLQVGTLPSTVDPEKVNIYLDGIAVPYNEAGDPGDGSSGWDWVTDDYSEVEFFGAGCEQLQTGRLTNIVMELGCQTIRIQ